MDIEQTAVENSTVTLVTFCIGSMLCGLPIEHIDEIKRVFRITRVHGAPPFINGIVNIRGNIITVIHSAQRIGIKPAGTFLNNKMIVIRTASEQIGLLVDTIEDTITVKKQCLIPPPSNMNEAIARYISSVCLCDSSLISILDIHTVTGTKYIDTEEQTSV